MSSRLLNLTPHPIVLHRPDGSTHTIIPESAPARLIEVTHPLGELAGVPLVRVGSVDVTGLPEYLNGVFLVVSSPVALAHPQRDDLLVPHDFVRDNAGRILGCRALARRFP